MDALPNREELLRVALFTPCESKEALARWIRVYLGVDLPGVKVDPESTSSPMDLVWELYDACRQNKDGYSQVLAYAARDSLKTFSSAIFEVLCIVHLERSVAHMAAILPQASKAQQYLKRHMSRPFLRDFVTKTNERSVEITRYHNNQTGENLTQDQYSSLAVGEQVNYREIKNYVTVIVCTIQGANSEHVPVMVVDEVDVVENPDAYEEAKMIPAPMNGMMPLTLYTSTRKYSFGLVQKEIDKQEDTKLIVRHWNIIDVTHRCHEDRHRPDLPKIDVYTSVGDQGNLRTILPAEWELLEAAEKKKYQQELAFQGCITNCRMFAACRGKLAEKPKCDKCANDGKACAGFFKPVAHVQNQFTKVTLDKAKAQLLCWKPSTEGLIFPNFSREIHSITAAQMAERITGEKHQPNFNKADLIRLLKDRGARFVAGADHGHTHNYAVVTGAILGNRCYILDVIAQPGLELSQKIEITQQRLENIEPETSIWADPEAPADNKTMKRHGLRLKDWTKGKGSVVDGISLVRLKLMPSFGRPEEAQLFFLRGDAGCELLMTRLGQYHWTVDASGTLTNVPDDEDDDEIDALRYLILNNFSPKTKVSVSIAQGESSTSQVTPGQKQYHTNTWMRQIISEKTGADSEEAPETGTGSGRKGSFSWSM